MRETFGRLFEGLTVLVTGHTGFKGSWLSIWLTELGARVVGYSLDPPTEPSNFMLCHLHERIVDLRGDVRDEARLRQVVEQHRPQVLLHLAAQPLVLPSYQAPRETFEINVCGTVNVLEAVRAGDSVRAVVCVTTDKVYRNREWLWGYREEDELGGHDPYSASKAMAELAVASYRQSFFADGRVAVATARAGNVIGGGDWGAHRLVPDCVRALAAGRPIALRNPTYIRPWQLVLEPLSGYLWLAALLLGPHGGRFAEAWNFGPVERRCVTTEELVRETIALWGGGGYETGCTQSEVETRTLRLNWDKAAYQLNWRPAYEWQEALAETVSWYREYADRQGRTPVTQAAAGDVDMYGACVEQIERYTARASQSGIAWAQPPGSGLDDA